MLSKKELKNLVKQSIAEILTEESHPEPEGSIRGTDVEVYNGRRYVLPLFLDMFHPKTHRRVGHIEFSSVKQAKNYFDKIVSNNTTNQYPIKIVDRKENILFHHVPKNTSLHSDINPSESLHEESHPEPYDQKTDTFALGPRDRTEPVTQDIPMQMIRQSLYKQISQAEKARKMTPSSYEKLDGMSLGDLQRYYNKIGLFGDSIHVPGIGWGGNKLKEANSNINKLSSSERNKISAGFAKAGLDGNGRFVKKEHGLQAVSQVLSSLGFQLDMVSGDLIMGDKGSRNFIFRRVNTPGQDTFTENPEISNSRIAFVWELLSPNKYEILAYAS